LLALVIGSAGWLDRSGLPRSVQLCTDNANVQALAQSPVYRINVAPLYGSIS